MKHPQILSSVGALVLILVLGTCATTRSRIHGEGPYARIDAAVLSPPQVAKVSIPDLAGFIDSISENDWEKVRGAFIWITHNITYDTERLFQGIERDDRRFASFYDRTAICSGYVTLFGEILDEFDIAHEVITGTTANAGEFTEALGYTPRHAWSKVRIDGQWHLFDPTWAAGGLNEDHSFTFRYNDRYFDADPALLIFTHLPDKQEDQLLQEHAVTPEQFEAINPEWAQFFAYGIDPTTVLDDERERTRTDLPKVYRVPERIGKINLRSELLSNPLRQNESRSLTIESSAPMGAVIVNGTIEKTLFNEGGTLLYQFDARETGVVVLALGTRERYFHLLEYSVVGNE